MPAVASTMQVCVLTPDLQFQYEERPVPTPAPGEVLIQVAYVGICGSDLHFYRHGRVGPEIIEQPLVLGHECSGTIVACGSGVPLGRIGERVSLEPQRPCRRCPECSRGVYHLCRDGGFFGAPPTDGALAEFVVLDATLAHPLPAAVSLVDAAVIEPLSVGLHAARKAGLSGGERALVAGAGPIGVLTAQALTVLGAGSVTVTDPFPERRAIAARLGVTQAVDPASVAGDRFDVFVDTSGSEAAVLAGVRGLEACGRVVLVGVGADVIALDPDAVRRRELVVTGVFRYCNTWPAALRLVARGAISLDGLVSSVHPFEEVATAFAGAGGASVMKVMISVGVPIDRPAPTT